MQKSTVKLYFREISTWLSGQVHPGTHCSSQIELVWSEPHEDPQAFAHSLKIVPSGHTISFSVIISLLFTK